MWKAGFGSKFVVPSDSQVWVQFEPESNDPSRSEILSKAGKFQMRTRTLDTSIAEIYSEHNATYNFYFREADIPAELKGSSTEVTIDTTETEKTNWEGEEVSLAKPWYDETLFSVGGVEITKKEALIGTAGIVAIIVVVVLVCCFISWRKRKQIAAGVRRASTFIKRQSLKLRNSLYGKPVEKKQEELPKGEVNEDFVGNRK